MSATGGQPSAASPDVVVSGRGRAPRRWRWTVLSGRAGERPPRRWPWVATAALLAAAGVVVVVVRPLVAAADFRALGSKWVTASALDHERSQVISQLVREAAPSDLATVTAAVLALQRQEAGQLVALRAGIGPGLARDSAVSALAAAERLALSREIADLDGGVALTLWGVATYQAIDRVQALLAADRSRFGVAATGSPHPARLTAADAALARLRQPLDARVPAELVVAVNSVQLQIIDLRSGRVTAAPAAMRLLTQAGVASPLLARAGFVVVQTMDGSVYAVPWAVAGVPRLLGTGQTFPAARPDAVWIWTGVGSAPGGSGHLVLVTGAGRRIAGPVQGLAALPGSPAFPDIIGAVPGGLVVAPTVEQNAPLSAHAGLWLWNPFNGRGLREIVRGCAQPLAVYGRLLAWLRCYPDDPLRASSVRITDTATGATRTVANPATATPFAADQPVAAFSPDGRWLCAYYSGTALGSTAIGLVNIKTGATSIIPGAPLVDVTSPIWWAPDSRWVFFATGGSSASDASQPWVDGTVPFAAYHVGDRSAVDLRYRGAATLLAVLPSISG